VLVDYLTGCALLARREVFERVGGFDAAFFAYSEDVDLALRAARAGLGSLLVGSAAALHAPSSSTGGGYGARRKYMMGVNSIWFLRRWGGPGQWLRFFVFDLATLPMVALLALPRGRLPGVCGKALGIWDGLRGRRVTAQRLAPGATWLW
jgi:GT2 family glycosyltransferase